MRLFRKTNPYLIKLQLKFEFDFLEIEKDVQRAIKSYGRPDWTQLNLTVTPKLDGEEAFHYGTGSLFDSKTKKFTHHEYEFSKVNSLLVGSAIEKFFNGLSVQFADQVGRMRIMKLDSRRCYSIHYDVCQRGHFAIQTNPGCFLSFIEESKDKSPTKRTVSQNYHIPKDGQFYLADTRHYHSANNTSNVDRIHLVVSML